MVHEDLGFETDCPFILQVMPGISDQARNGLYPHRSLRGSRFGFFIARRKEAEETREGMGGEGGRGRFVTRYKLRRLRFSRLDKRKQKHATPTQTANIATY